MTKLHLTASQPTGDRPLASVGTLTRLLGAGVFIVGLVGQQPVVLFAGLLIVFATSIPRIKSPAPRADAALPVAEQPATTDHSSDANNTLPEWLKYAPPAAHTPAKPHPKPRPGRPTTTTTPDSPPPEQPPTAIPRQTTAKPAAPTAANTSPENPIIRLRPVVPIHRGMPIHSWLGGAPHMPDDMAWPMADGKPALFLAQISCSQLPPGSGAGAARARAGSSPSPLRTSPARRSCAIAKASDPNASPRPSLHRRRAAHA
ncbi:YwqG family protein [Rhodobacteraceae bacterium D3-12]|nr:YwqG family protein [Rhodobacteraceae bacterium D3-12]